MPYNGGMKRRKWWIIGLSVALLAACVGVWQRTERRPFPFLNEAELVSSRLASDSLFETPTVVETYRLNRSLREVEEVFMRTVARTNGWTRRAQNTGMGADYRTSGYYHVGPTHDVEISEGVPVEDALHVVRPTTIVVWRFGTWRDRFRSALHGVHNIP